MGGGGNQQFSSPFSGQQSPYGFQQPYGNQSYQQPFQGFQQGYQQPYQQQYQPQQQYGGFGNYGGFNPQGGGIMSMLANLFGGGYGGGFSGGYGQGMGYGQYPMQQAPTGYRAMPQMQQQMPTQQMNQMPPMVPAIVRASQQAPDWALPMASNQGQLGPSNQQPIQGAVDMLSPSIAAPIIGTGFNQAGQSLSGMQVESQNPQNGLGGAAPIGVPTTIGTGTFQ